MALALRHAIRPAITLAAVGASVALFACGGGEEASGEDDQANAEDAGIEYAECMRGNGVDIPDPEPGGGGFRLVPGEGVDPSSESFQAAQEECGPILDEAIPEGERPDPAELEDQLHTMTECLRDKGYDVPEPQIVTPGEEPAEGDAGEAGAFREELDRLQDDPEFQQAQEACTEEAGLPAGGFGGNPDAPDGGGE